ncbi:anthranilate synthase component 1 [Reichenbachiella faecimaris]|uniref:Anthranilate synthase component 1 n=1 Tax=Reichenbachiella faecimaris TaxID=692418 RepID=A0A1W2G4X0_REIFA|nr:anthranilate synthase component I family protein [Reichenbachiella faecimaris]SMD31643.1 anthranilate synthase component 1 [Reichenbachiella faecimaris]
MKQINIYSKTREILGDILTPVSIYLKIRDRFPNSFLLESSDYHAKENSISYIAFSPLAEFKVDKGYVIKQMPGRAANFTPLDQTNALAAFQKFLGSFKTDKDESAGYTKAGLFGFTAYEGVQLFENIVFNPDKTKDFDVPLMQYFFFEYVIAFDHFSNKIFITHNALADKSQSYNLDEIEMLISSNNTPEYSFQSNGKIKSNMTDEEYRASVLKAIQHCQLGDTFQMVLSRSFNTEFKGDEFLLYRALRSINPSPYLFYFDYGSFKIFGSSPEAQLEVNDGQAAIFPIAGTYKRTGDDEQDAVAAKALSEDEKETSEHVMLVDLARNDLSKSGDQVTVEKFKEIQFFSHVIHLVSKVSTFLKNGKTAIDLAADTFPAGTLSGAPKHRAMQLIDEYESSQRGYYGGMIGLMDFHGNFNHAILIRSFLSQNNKLHFRAGAGVVAKSDPDSEVQEVYNKVGALQSAIQKADHINQKLEAQQ